MLHKKSKLGCPNGDGPPAACRTHHATFFVYKTATEQALSSLSHTSARTLPSCDLRLVLVARLPRRASAPAPTLPSRMQGPSTGSGGSRAPPPPRPGRRLPHPYDRRRVTVFASDGRLYQVDYAMNAVKLAGVTSVGVRGADSVCIVGQLKAKDKLMDAASSSNMFKITERLGLLTTGMAVSVYLVEFVRVALQCDGRALAHQARNQTAEFRSKWGYEMPPDMLAQWIADGSQVWTQHISKRPSGVVAMILGIDEEKETPQLFTSDPAGYFLGHEAVSAGSKDREATNFLEKNMKDHPSLSFEATIQMAISALQYALKQDLTATDIEVGVVRKDDPIFRLLSATEIDEHLKVINQDQEKQS
ncbi:hypothetical protein PR202_gb21626 [Eleusine coracana subsp. coracana]|uniref:Proteasome alpha-type subunits domain-containing protein n=1 Tax=Eleusine coracana subsp. coracana TaxID=191504 RepID=A0AAV5FDN1_ELECO|nr:hypothetical protein PR202_gb21626 [Eleusine coracana subsp. coracana]